VTTLLRGMNDVIVYCVSPGPWQVVALPSLALATEADRVFFLRASRVVDMDSPEKVWIAVL
jgi:hypothetical protein